MKGVQYDSFSVAQTLTRCVSRISLHRLARLEPFEALSFLNQTLENVSVSKE